MSYFGKNIRKIRSIKSLSQQEFGELFGLKRATLGAYEEERSEPKIETIINIAKHFSISIDDLLTRELTVNDIARFKEEFTTDVDLLKAETLKAVPYIGKESYETYPKRRTEADYISSLPQLILPLTSKRKYRAMEVEGLEMSEGAESFYPKDVVIGEHISKKNFKSIEDESLVIVVTEEDIIFRKYSASEKHLLLRANHVGIEDVHIDWNEVLEIWKVQHAYYHRLPKNASYSVEVQLQKLEEKINRMEAGK